MLKFLSNVSVYVIILYFKLIFLDKLIRLIFKDNFQRQKLSVCYKAKFEGYSLFYSSKFIYKVNI
jgi:hypothetical protein